MSDPIIKPAAYGCSGCTGLYDTPCDCEYSMQLPLFIRADLVKAAINVMSLAGHGTPEISDVDDAIAQLLGEVEK